jgi:Tfp pilus assembly protein PilN
VSGAKSVGIVVGGEPRVDLLPPELKEAKRVRRVRRGMLLLLALAVVLCVGAFGAAWSLALLGQQRLDAENARTSELIAEQAQFIEARTTAQRVDTAEAALAIGASTEIDFAKFFRDVTATLPANCSIVTANADGGSPFEVYAQAVVPLQPQRIATLNFAVRTTSLLDVQAWLDSLQDIKGFTDAMPTAVKAEPDGTMTAAITMHVDTGALSNRFASVADAKSPSTASEPAGTEGAKN